MMLWPHAAVVFNTRGFLSPVRGSGSYDVSSIKTQDVTYLHTCTWWNSSDRHAELFLHTRVQRANITVTGRIRVDNVAR